jgi:hypothetical protein
MNPRKIIAMAEKEILAIFEEYFDRQEDNSSKSSKDSPLSWAIKRLSSAIESIDNGIQREKFITTISDAIWLLGTQVQLLY